jgi:hypothetical protein
MRTGEATELVRQVFIREVIGPGSSNERSECDDYYDMHADSHNQIPSFEFKLMGIARF